MRYLLSFTSVALLLGSVACGGADGVEPRGSADSALKSKAPKQDKGKSQPHDGLPGNPAPLEPVADPSCPEDVSTAYHECFVENQAGCTTESSDGVVTSVTLDAACIEAACGDREELCGNAPPAEGCPVPEICMLCDDGQCAKAVFGAECSDLTWSCEPDGQQTPPSTDVPDSCPVPEICMLCDDGQCAEAVFGAECSDLTWSCEADGEPTPPTPTPGVDCAIPEICKLCPDNSCAVPFVTDENCTIDWACAL